MSNSFLFLAGCYSLEKWQSFSMLLSWTNEALLGQLSNSGGKAVRIIFIPDFQRKLLDLNNLRNLELITFGWHPNLYYFKGNSLCFLM